MQEFKTCSINLTLVDLIKDLFRELQTIYKSRAQINSLLVPLVEAINFPNQNERKINFQIPENEVQFSQIELQKIESEEAASNLLFEFRNKNLEEIELEASHLKRKVKNLFKNSSLKR